MTASADTGTNFEHWIRENSPSLAFYSNSKGGGFIGKRNLKSALLAKAARDLGREYYPQKFNEAWDRLLKEGFVQHLIERGKPKGVAGSSGTASPISTKATIAHSDQQGQVSSVANAPSNNHPDMWPTSGIKAANIAGLSKTVPLRFGSAGPATLPVVTPGGSLTAETARELAAFGGAVIRRGASAQVNIAIPQNRLKSSPSSHHDGSSSTSASSSVAPVHSSRPSTPPAVGESPATSPQLLSSGTPHSQVQPPEPAQSWKSLEVSLVDASLLRGFSPQVGPSALSNPKSETASGTIAETPAPGIHRGATTLPVPPPQQTSQSISALTQKFQHQQSSSSPSGHSFKPQPPLPPQYLSQAPVIQAFPSRPRPPPPPPMSISQTQPPPTTVHHHSGLHDLSRQNSAMSPHVIYSPPLRLNEISLPYRVQYHILTLLISTLEFVFYDFSSKWFPEILNSNFWDCPEAAEVTTWSTSILHALNSASGEIQIQTSDNPSSPVGTRTKINRKPQPHALAHLTNLLRSVNDLHSDVSRRVFISGEKLLGYLDNSIRVSNLLGCPGRASELEDITYYVKEALGGIGMVREAVRGTLNEKMEVINRKREDLMRLEREALKEASKFEREQCTKLGLDLMITLEPKFAKLDWSSQPNRPRGNSWKEPTILSSEQMVAPGGIGSFFPPMPPSRSEERSVERQSKGKGVDKTPTPSTPIDRGRTREPHMPINNSKNPSPITPRSDDAPPAIPAKAAKRLSNLYPSTSPILDYDTDIEHEREGPGGVGLEITLSQSGFPQTSASSVSRSRILRKEGIDTSDVRPVTPAQVNLVREPIPPGTPVPISKLIEEDDTLELAIRRNSTRSIASPFLNLNAESILPMERGKSVPAPTNRRAEDAGTPTAEKRHSTAVTGGVLNTGPTPPLTPKEAKVTSIEAGQQSEQSRGFFEGEHRSEA